MSKPLARPPEQKATTFKGLILSRRTKRNVLANSLNVLLTAVFDGDVDALRVAVEDYCAKQKGKGGAA